MDGVENTYCLLYTSESTNIHEIDGVIIYRFSSGLCFANAKVLVRDIEDHLKHDTKAVIIDADVYKRQATRRVSSGFTSLSQRI